MKRFILLTFFLGMHAAYAQSGDLIPQSPTDTNLKNSGSDISSGANRATPRTELEQQQQEEIREKEMLENRYDVPDDREDKEFNQNGTMDP